MENFARIVTVIISINTVNYKIESNVILSFAFRNQWNFFWSLFIEKLNLYGITIGRD